MKEKFAHLPYRNNVSIIPIKNNKFLLAHHIGDPDDWWKFPQGGIDESENVIEAGLREFSEEIGTNKIKLLGLSKYVNNYDWPMSIIKRSGHSYKGQTQRFIIVEVEAEEHELIPDQTEIKDIMWVSKEELLKHHNNLEHPTFTKFHTYNDTLEKIFKEFPHIFKD